KVVICFAIWSAERPVYCQTTVTTGMSISGKISVGVFLIDTTPSSNIKSAITTNVYGRRSASLTIHIRREPVHRLESQRSDAEPGHRHVSSPRVEGRAWRHVSRPNREKADAG